MREIERPWWLLVNKAAGLTTTIQEEIKPGEQIYIVRGEPMVQGLAWLIWGPVAAIVTVALLAAIAIILNVREQSGLLRALFIACFLILPALTWGGITVLVIQRSKAYLQSVRQAETRIATIHLNQSEGLLAFQANNSAIERIIGYGDIQQVRVTFPIGEYEGKRARLTLETNQGPLILLDETLGTRIQKQDLAQKIQQVITLYAR